MHLELGYPGLKFLPDLQKFRATYPANAAQVAEHLENHELVEWVRQLHFLLAEHWSRYYRFWKFTVFGRFDGRSQRLDPELGDRLGELVGADHAMLDADEFGQASRFVQLPAGQTRTLSRHRERIRLRRAGCRRRPTARGFAPRESCPLETSRRRPWRSWRPCTRP